MYNLKSYYGLFFKKYICHETQNTQGKYQIHICPNIDTKSKINKKSKSELFPLYENVAIKYMKSAFVSKDKCQRQHLENSVKT